MQNIVDLIFQLTSGDDLIAENAVKELGKLGKLGKLALEKLVGLLKNEDVDIRWWAIRALSEFEEPKASQQIIAHLEDKDLAVQQCAAVALRIKPQENSINRLIPLLDHEDQLLSQLASDALVANGKKSTQSLIEVIQNGSQKAQIQAVRALARIGDTSSIATLFNLLDGNSAIMEYWANEGLDKMGIGMSFFDPS